MQRLNLSNIPADQAIAQACAVLQAGGLLIYPTETVYGLGVDATNPQAVQKLLQFKSKREGKPLSIAVADKAMAEKYAQLTQQAKDMYQRLLPGPVTIVSQAKDTLAPGVASEFGTIGVRIPAYQLIIDIVKAYGKPITATSANMSGARRPYSYQDIWEPLSERQRGLLDLMLDAGTLPPADPSVVIDTTTDTPLTLREASHSTLLKDWIKTKGSSEVVETQSPQATQDLAGKLMLKHWEAIKKNGLILGLDGPLGAGKTVFCQGVAKFLNITAPLTSPTYTFQETYNWRRQDITGELHHFDLWKIENAKQLELLDIPSLIKPNTVVLIEWFSQQGAALIQQLNNKATKIVHCEIADLGENKRSCTIA